MAKNKTGSYQFTRPFFDFAFNNPICKSQHISLYCWIVELNNRLKWKDNFGLPTSDSMEGLSIGNKNTYYNALRDLELWGFIKIITPAKNQYQSCIIELCRNTNELANLIIAVSKVNQHDTRHRTGTVPIDKHKGKPLLKTVKTIKTVKRDRVFSPPHFDDVFNYFVFENWPANKADSESKKFIAYYDSVGWIIKKQKMKSWKGAAAGWMLRDNEFVNKKNNQNGTTINRSGIETTIDTATKYWNDKYGEFDPERDTGR